MTLGTGDSSGEVSLEKMWNHDFKNSLTKEVKLEDLIKYIIRGGWPESLGLSLS